GAGEPLALECGVHTVESMRKRRGAAGRPLCGEPVFVQQPAEPVVSTEAIEPQSLICRRCLVSWRWVRGGWPRGGGGMGRMCVVGRDVSAEDVPKRGGADDQQPIRALPPQAPDPALGMRPRVRRFEGRLDHADALAAEDLVEVARELRI